MKILIVGAGGHGRVVLDILTCAGQHDVLGFVDSQPALAGRRIDGFPVLGTLDDLPRLRTDLAIEGAIIAIDPRTGAIRAMVGGYDFERSQFNRALVSLRQPGSAFKPIIYATAIDGGMTPATLVLDAPVVYEQDDPGKTWKPENYEKRFFGPITLREALRHSRNAATVRLLEQIGVRRVTEFSRQLGIQSPLSRDLSLALGSSGVTLEELTSAYGVFANQGLALQPYTISIAKDQEDRSEEHTSELQSH